MSLKILKKIFSYIIKMSNTTDTQPTTPSEPLPVTFTSADVQVVMNIMDVASSRGCFRTAEMKGVGEFYEKLQSLVPKKAESSEKSE